MEEHMNIRHKATSIRLLDFHSIPMRTFHMTWIAFFVCFFGWFGLAPLIPVIRDELHLTKEQVGNSAIAAVAITILARILMGWLCDRIGPRRAYTWLLVLGSLPVMGVGLSHDYASFLIFRLAIGAIGASFVITSYHTSVMFAPNLVGTANATTAGWGNLGGGVTQFAMPLLFGAFMSYGAGSWWSWRLAMLVAGAALFVTGIAYYFLTEDTPDGDFQKLRAEGAMDNASRSPGAFWKVCHDPRVWALALLYAASFGIELTIDNFAALYFTDYFHLALGMAGAVASTFGMMNLFARALGGILSDRCNRRWGLRGRVFAAGHHHRCGGDGYDAVLPHARSPAGHRQHDVYGPVREDVEWRELRGGSLREQARSRRRGRNRRRGRKRWARFWPGSFSKPPSLTYPQAFMILGVLILLCSVCAFAVRFSETDEIAAKHEMAARLDARLVRGSAADGQAGD